MIRRIQTRPSRRRFVHALGAGCIAPVAGCLGGGVGDNEEGDGGGVDETEEGEPVATDWLSATLTDTTSGEEFHVDAFEQTTLVHTFASNCLTCARQQEEFVTLWARRDDIEIVELSVDPNDSPEDISAHADSAGLEWRVGVSPEPVTGSLVEEFGQTVTISAQSPIIIVCQDGTTDTVSKVADADELERAIGETC